MYSQHDEEKHILRIVGDRVGRFLDIGAWNPTKFSNTRALFERGWSGVMGAPSPGPFMELLKEYGNCERIQLVSAAVAEFVGPPPYGILKFHVSQDSVSTSVEEHYQKWKNSAKYDGIFYAASITLRTLMDHFGSDYDFISIDIEGASADLFLRALDIGFGP